MSEKFSWGLVYLFFILACSIPATLNGQTNTASIKDSLFKRFALPSSSFHSAYPYYIVDEFHLPAEAKLVRTLPGGLAVIELHDAVAFGKLQSNVKIAVANNRWKLSPTLENKQEPDKERLFIISGITLYELQDALKNIGLGPNILSVDSSSKSVIIKGNSKKLLAALLPLNEVIFIDERMAPHSETRIIGYDRSINAVNAVDYLLPGADGHGKVVGIKEQRMDQTDMDILKRVLPSTIAATSVTDHATVIASIAGGAGNSFYDGRGIAHACSFFPSSFTNLFPDDAALLQASNVYLQNHSYGTVVQQFYGAEALSYDAQLWAHKQLLHVFSAGNAGTSSATDGRYAGIAGYANLTANFKMAKNVITVGAMDSKGNIAAESSAGPVYDGRLAPQLTALGPNGTSDAAALVSGTIAVMQQVYADSNNGALPSASLIKAVLYNTAVDIFKNGIDYKTGYGLLNSYEAIKSLQRKEYDAAKLSQGQQWTKWIHVPANAARFKITLSWTDTAALLNNSKALVNDLDLEVENAGNSFVYQPWVLSASASADALGQAPIRKRDSLNVSEQVSISLPTEGDYIIRVKGYAVQNGLVPFDVVYHIDTLNSFEFTNPQHSSDINISEKDSVRVKWKTFVADSNQTGNLYASYDRGMNWQLVKASQKLTDQQYWWRLKDTASTALLRMETAFGSFLSKEVVIAPVIRPRVDFLCADSFGLSWPKHVYASSYRIFALTDSPYLKLVRTVGDTFSIFQRSQFPSDVYAVEPVLSNSIPAVRSRSIDIQLQGTGCFYQSFYHVLMDKNQLDLVLELSAPVYVDSIFFEQVDGNGVLVKRWATRKAFAGNSTYHQLLNEITEGTTYWRAGIRLKTGAVVYTGIIAVHTTGKHYIQFYPNPAKRDQPLVYLLQQGIGTDAHLQLFDMSGRMLRNYMEMPDRVDATAFPSGMLIYKLFDGSGKLLETGKLVIL